MTSAVTARQTVSRLRAAAIIPVLRADASDAAIRVAELLIAEGLGAIEVTMTVPDAIETIAILVRRLGSDAIIGAGTVTDAESARRAIDAGAEFIVSPALVEEVVVVAKQNDVAMLPGALTPTEILAAVRAGADMVKIFPAQSVGGASYIRILRGPFPDIAFVPTGGVTLETIGDFFRAGAAAVGVGSELVPRDALARGDYEHVRMLARQFVSARRASG